MAAFTSSLEKALHQAPLLANERAHEYATLEHLLLALLEDHDAVTAIRARDVDVTQLRRTVTKYVDSELQNLVSGFDGDAKPTSGFERVIQNAVVHAQSSDHEEVTGANVINAIAAERESYAAHFLTGKK